MNAPNPLAAATAAAAAVRTRRVTRRWFAGAAVLLVWLVLGSAPSARAGDVDSAKRQVEKLRVDVDSGSWDSVEQDVKSAEEFLDGVPDAERAPVQKDLDALRAKAMAGLKAAKGKSVLETSKRELDRAADDLANSPLAAADTLDKAIARLSGDDAKKYADPEAVKKLLARAASLRAMAASKAAGMKLDRAAPIVKELDDAMAAQPFKAAASNEDLDHVTQQLNSLMSRIRGALEGVPADDARAKAITEKLAAYQKQIDAAAGGAMASQAAAGLARQWKAQQEYFAGWEQEKDGPTWQEYVSHQSDEVSKLQMPKTVELLTRMHGWFEEPGVKPTAEQYKDDASVKATLAEAHAAVDAAAAKLHAAFGKVLDGAERVETPADETVRNKAAYLADRADMWFKGTAYHDPDVARAKKLGEKWAGAMAGAVAAREAAMKQMTAAATVAWPAIAAAVHADGGFTPDKLEQFKGKTIHLTANNRLGWDYLPGPYQFATAINGMPVAGKFDAQVAAAVAEANRRTGQESLPDEGWDLYATVEGPGKIQERRQESGKVKVDGREVGTVSTERNEAVPCAVVRIFALHAGPVAVGAGTLGADGQPLLGTDGQPLLGVDGRPRTVPPPAAVGASSFKTFEHVAELLLCLAAAALAVMKARPAVAGHPAGGAAPISAPSVSSFATGDNVALAGLALAALGVLWLLAKLVLGDLLPALSLTLAGLYLACDWLVARKLLPPTLAATLKPLGVPIAGATALFGVLHLFLAHWVLF